MDRIPEEVWLQVFAWLDLASLIQVACVNRFTYQLVTSSGVPWRYIDLRRCSSRHINYNYGVHNFNPFEQVDFDTIINMLPNGATSVAPSLFPQRIYESHLLSLFNGWLHKSALHAIVRVRLDYTGVTSNALHVLLARCPQLEWLSLRHCNQVHQSRLSSILRGFWDHGNCLKLRYLYVGNGYVTGRRNPHRNPQYVHFQRADNAACLDIMKEMLKDYQTQQEERGIKPVVQIRLARDRTSRLPETSDAGQLRSANDPSEITTIEHPIEVWPMPCDSCPSGVCVSRRHWCESCNKVAYLCTNCCKQFTCFSGCGRYRCVACVRLTGTSVVCPSIDHKIGFLCSHCNNRRACTCPEVRMYCNLHQVMHEHDSPMNNLNCRRCGRWTCVFCNKFSTCRCRPNLALCEDCRTLQCARCNLPPGEISIDWICSRCNRYLCVNCNDYSENPTTSTVMHNQTSDNSVNVFQAI